MFVFRNVVAKARDSRGAARNKRKEEERSGRFAKSATLVPICVPTRLLSGAETGFVTRRKI
jgi:hypothetical protein